MEKPLVALFSDSNFLSLNLLENFLSKNCRVAVFTPDKTSWLKKTEHISIRSNLEILNEKDFDGFGPINYAIFSLGFIEKKNAYKKIREIYQTGAFRNVKSLCVLPFEVFGTKENARIPVNSNLGVIYVGDLFGARMDWGGELLTQEVVEDSWKRREMNLSVGELFYPLFVTQVAREIVKWVFSFGPYGKEIFLVGPQTSGTSFWKEMSKVAPGLKLSYNNGLARVLPRGYEIQSLPCNLSFVLRETFSWIAKNHKAPGGSIEEIESKTKTLKITLTVVLILLVFPFVCILLNAGLFYLSFRSFMTGNSGEARNVLLLTKTPALIGRGESRILSFVPVFGEVYKETNFVLNLSFQAADLGVNGIYLADTSKELFEKVLGNEIYDPQMYSSQIKLGLEYIYQNLSLIDLDIENQASKNVFLAKKVQKKFDFAKAEKLSFEGARIANELPAILGKYEKRSYLMLFQNNMELRPTGGFIGSFGILTFEGGRMIDFGVSDVYSADGQLRGHIEPPEPIKKYLDEANWYLRDSNWDPDFPTSAKRAEWFLDKEIDRQVEGVISIDLHPVKDLLGITGPIYLPDYNMDVTEDNLYEKTQSEVQQEFFPGTHKKASFLTALSRNLVTELPNLSSGAKLQVLKKFYQSLESRHMQLYLHDEEMQKSVSTLNWGGEVLTPSCGEGCYADFVGVVEANVGVNKANYFVTRNQNLEVEVQPDKIQRKLTLEIVNSANPDLGLAGKYKAYIRVLVPQESEVEGSFDIIDAKGKKEIGFLAEVLGGDTQEFTISWSSPLANTGDYGIYIRKQAGTGENGKASVAINGDVLYNSNLTRDLWIQKP